jgi:hypothetical protein
MLLQLSRFLGFCITKKDYIDDLLSSNDVMFLQKQWLTDAQLSELGWINYDFLYHGISGIDKDEIFLGQPRGGCAIFWRSNMSAVAESIQTSVCRMPALCLL